MECSKALVIMNKLRPGPNGKKLRASKPALGINIENNNMTKGEKS